MKNKNINYIYVVSTVSLKIRTEEDLNLDFEIHKIKYPYWRNKSYEDFYNFEKGWNYHKYKLEKEDNSYFLSLEDAKDAVSRNFANINDGGVYNYVLINKIPIGKAYAMLQSEDVYIFKYDKELDVYTEVDLDSSEETKYITSLV